MSPDGFIIVTGSRKIGALMFNAMNGSLVQEIPLDYFLDLGTIRISADNKHMLTALRGHPIQVWDISVKPARKVATLSAPLTHAEISDDGKLVFGSTGAAKSKVALYSAMDGSESKTLHSTLFKGEVDLSGIPKLKLLHMHGAFAYPRRDSARIFQVWSLDGDTLIRDIDTKLRPGIFGFFHEYNPAGDKLWISSTLDSGDIYDTPTGKMLATFNPFDAVVNTLSISASVTDKFIFSVNTISGDQLIQQFKLDDLTLVGTYPIPEQPMFNQRTGRLVLSWDGSIMAAEVRMPSVYPATLSGFRVYKIK